MSGQRPAPIIPIVDAFSVFPLVAASPTESFPNLIPGITTSSSEKPFEEIKRRESQVITDPSKVIVEGSSGKVPSQKQSQVVGPEQEGEDIAPQPLSVSQNNNSISASQLSLNAKDVLSVSFQDFCYSVPIKNSRKTIQKPILHNMSARFRAGKLTVILGGSGAGKTTLLTALSGTAESGTVSGTIKVNDQKVMGSDIRKLSGFVFQDDIAMPTLTGIEAIRLSAKLRLPSSISKEQQEERIQELISMLQLENACNTVFGTSDTKGMSGGERKRCCIAMEMVTNPSLLFLDEPTTGLDTYTAFNVVLLLKKLTENGRTVIATLHQPSSEIFHLIDDLLFMAKGEIVYCGPAQKCVDYFSRLGYTCPKYTNPSDFLFMNVAYDISDVVNSKPNVAQGQQAAPKGEEEEKSPVSPTKADADRVDRLLQAWKDSPENAKLIHRIENPPANAPPLTVKTRFQQAYPIQFEVLGRRALQNAIRNPLLFRARMGQIVVLGFIVSVVYWNIPGKSSDAQAQNRIGSLFFLVINQIIGTTAGTLSVFGIEKGVFKREFNNNYYQLGPYFLSKVLVELPFQIIMPWLFVTVVYWCIGFQNVASKYFIQVLTLIFVANTGAALGVAFASAVSNIDVALALFPVVLLPMTTFTGLFVQLDTLPDWISWFQYIVPTKYGFSAVAKNEFEGLNNCTEVPSGSGYVENCVDIGNSLLDQFGLSGGPSIAANIAILAAMYLIMLLFSYFMLWKTVVKSNTLKYVTK